MTPRSDTNETDSESTPVGESDERAETDDYRRLSENPYAQPVPETFEWPEDVPRWKDDPYFEAISLRLLDHYDLGRDHEFEGQQVEMYGQLNITNERHAMHPSLSFAEHVSREHLFVVREGQPTVSSLEALETLGEKLADRWVDTTEDHYSTDFTFVIVSEAIPDSVRAFLDGYSNRTLLRLGYYGHYELNFAVVAPDAEQLVESENTDIGAAFRTWELIEDDEPGIVARLLNWMAR